MEARGAQGHVATQRLDANREAFDQLVDDARRARRQPALAASLAQAAAELAWFNHTGWYASPDLEALTHDLGTRHVRPSAAGPGGRPRRTLHVATQLYATGGSTQVVAAWTRELADRAHHVVVTRQGTTPLPAKVTSQLGERVRLTRLDTRPGSLLQRAARLRAAAAAADLVLVQPHPYDVVPALAFADRDGLPPVVYLDHADHVFWLGTTSTDHVMHLRRSGQRLAQERRGLPPDRSLVGNRPLALRRRTMARADAKAEWGLGADELLLLSAAEATKFVREDGPHLSELVEPLLERLPGLTWLVAGPAPDDEPWAALARRTGGRARAVGRVTDMTTLHQAADVYLDSFPLASLTSLLESAALGNPVVTFRGHPESCAVFGSDSPGVDEHLVRPTTGQELRDALTGLCEDEQLRRRTGAAVADAVVDGHGGPQWVAAAEALYALPAGVDSRGHAPVHATDPVDLMTAAVMAATAHRRDAGATLAGHLGTMPLLPRLSAWHGLRGHGLRDHAGAGALLPEWARAGVRARVPAKAER